MFSSQKIIIDFHVFPIAIYTRNEPEYIYLTFYEIAPASGTFISSLSQIEVNLENPLQKNNYTLQAPQESRATREVLKNGALEIWTKSLKTPVKGFKF